jgi:hypothetical protein
MGYQNGEFMSNNPMNFIRDFLNYVDKEGIYDQFDKDTQKMVTSAGVEALIKEAKSYLPEKLKPLEAAKRMRDLNEDERDQLIKDADEARIIDLRKRFQKKMSINQGAQGIVARLVEAVKAQDNVKLGEVLLDAKSLVDGPENLENFE